MPRVLSPCPACDRHVANDELRCPMCRAALAPGWAPAPVAARTARTGRAARFAWRILLLASASGCGARTGLAGEAAPTVDAAPARDAGATIARDAGRDAGGDAGRDAGEDAGDFDAGDTAIYGAPPPDRPEVPIHAVAPPEPPRVVRRRRRRR